MKTLNKDTSGITLTELLIVVIVIGILAAVAIPTYTNIVMKQRVENFRNNAMTIFYAWKQYNMINNRLFASNNTLDNPAVLPLTEDMERELGVDINDSYFTYNVMDPDWYGPDQYILIARDLQHRYIYAQFIPHTEVIDWFLWERTDSYYKQYLPHD